MKRNIYILSILLFASIVSMEVLARELCDCYDSCTFIHPRKVSTKVKKMIKVRDGYITESYLEIDHKLPLCLGGTNNMENLQALTKEQHKIKTEHDMLLLYYIQNCLMTIEEAQNEALDYKAE